MPPQLLIQVETKMVNLLGQCIQMKQTKSRVMVGQNDRVSPLKSAVAVRCHLHLLHAEVRGYMSYLPLTKLSICSLEVFCLSSAHNSEMNSAFQFRNAPKLFVCLLVCFNRMYEH